eukprot:661750-Amphidinium_carterae.2
MMGAMKTSMNSRAEVFSNSSKLELFILAKTFLMLCKRDVNGTTPRPQRCQSPSNSADCNGGNGLQGARRPPAP